METDSFFTMQKRKLLLIPILLSVLALVISVWWGIRERWDMAGINLDLSESTAITSEYEKKLKEKPDSIIIKYNLACFYYKQKRYAEALAIFKVVLNSMESDDHLTRNTLYNSGNSLFRLSEEEKDLSKSISLLGQSLEFYRSIINKENRKNKYSIMKVEKDEDAHYNYVVVRRRIKILSDELKKQKKQENQQKDLYQLIKELKAREEEIKEELVRMKADPSSRQTAEKRVELLKKHQENLKQLATIKDKIIQTFKASQPVQHSPGKSAKTI